MLASWIGSDDDGWLFLEPIGSGMRRFRGSSGLKVAVAFMYTGKCARLLQDKLMDRRRIARFGGGSYFCVAASSSELTRAATLTLSCYARDGSEWPGKRGGAVLKVNTSGA